MYIFSFCYFYHFNSTDDWCNMLSAIQEFIHSINLRHARITLLARTILFIHGTPF